MKGRSEAALPGIAGGRGWIVRTSTGSAQRFHELEPVPATDHEIWIHRVDRPAVVFGSTQVRDGIQGVHDSADTAVADVPIEVCRRRSGGGLVIVRPDDVWIDAVVPRHSPLHVDDVGLAFHWFGQVWLEALRSLRDPGSDDPRLRLAAPPPGRRAADRPFFCFADIGHGEVLDGDRKVVGISQRRTRTWTRLQSLLVTDWKPDEVEKLVARALTAIDHVDRDRTSLGAPPHHATDVRAGLAGDPSRSAPPPGRILHEVVGRLPIVTGNG